jgi:hypothetical protein
MSAVSRQGAGGNEGYLSFPHEKSLFLAHHEFERLKSIRL